MSTQFLLPDLGEGLPEAEIVSWLVSVGDEVALNQTIAEVETAKAIVELPSPYAGTVSELFANAGDVVEVGKPLISFTLEGEDQNPPSAAPEPEGADEEEVVPPNLVGYGAAPAGKGRPVRRARRNEGEAEASVAAVPTTPAHVESIATPVAADRPRSTPPVRKFARDRGVDLVEVAGSGEAGRITRADVEGFLSESLTTAHAQPVLTSNTGERETRTPIKGVRKFTAAAMVQSAFTAPHVTCFHTIDVTETTALVARLRADRKWQDQRIGVMAFVAKAVCLALRNSPTLNTKWDEAAGEIVQFNYVNLGIAAATPRGLVVPNVTDAGDLSVADLATRISELAKTARDGKTTPAALSGGTFSISNIGTFGIEAGTPILNPGEAGILAVGAVQKRPWEYKGEVALRDVMTLSLSFDHRLVDGEQGARFLTDVGAVLSDPGRAMLF